MSATLAAPPARPTPRADADLRPRPTASHGWWWLALLALSGALFAAGSFWLLQARGAVAAELVYWQAQRQLVLGVDPPRLSALLTSDQPLVLYVVLVAGAAIVAGALLAAISVVVTARGWWQALSDVVGWWWLLPTLLTIVHPAFVLAGQYPAPVLRALLLIGCVSWLLRFTAEGAIYALLVAAAALAGLGLLEAAPWVLWLYFAVALILADPRRPAEQTARVLMLLFPAVFLALGRALLAAPVGGSAAAGTARRAACDVASNGLLGGVDPGCFSGLGAAALLTSIADLVWYAPAMLGLGLWAIGRVAARPRRIGRTGVGLLLATPLLEPVVRPWLAPETVLPGPLLVLVPLLAGPLLAEYALGAGRGVRGTALALGLISVGLAAGLALAWLALVPVAAAARQPFEPEARALIGAAVGPSSPWLEPYRAAATTADAQAGADARVLLDDARLFPIVALLARPSGLVLPDHPLYGVAAQCSSRFARLVVLSTAADAPGSAWSARLANYDLVGDYPPVHVYARQAEPGRPDCAGLSPG